MGINFLQSLASKSPPSTALIFTKPSRTHNQTFLPFPHRSLRISPINSTDSTSSDNNSNTGGDSEPPPFPPPATQPNNVEIRFRRRTRRRSKQEREDGEFTKAQASAKAPAPPKKWEDMNLTEKAIELYVGEKGLLFWLNKFAYASIYIIIGGWILFRFVGPSLNLYQLDSAPLAPTSIFKGS